MGHVPPCRQLRMVICYLTVLLQVICCYYCKELGGITLRMVKVWLSFAIYRVMGEFRLEGTSGGVSTNLLALKAGPDHITQGFIQISLGHFLG